MIDPWNPSTFSHELMQALECNAELIESFFREESKLMDEHLNSSPYESLKPNRFHFEFSNFKENTITEILKCSRIRVWHYTRLTDFEVNEMQNQLVLSNLDYLKLRLEFLVANDLLTDEESQLVFEQSPFHRQGPNRSGMLWTSTTPIPISDSGVEPLLQNWGGESAYFWLRNEQVKAKLTKIGLPRVIEIEVELTDGLNAFKVSETILQAWAKKLGLSIAPSGTDLSIKSSIVKAKVVNVHTKGENSFSVLAKSYPDNVHNLLTK